MCEELVCRGFIQGKIKQLNLPRSAIVINSILFALGHGGNSGFSPLTFLNLLLFALIMSFFRIGSSSLWIVGTYHSAWNFTEGIICGTSVSGMTNFDLFFSSIPNLKSPLITGSKFGIEASIITLILQFLLLAAVLHHYHNSAVLRNYLEI